MLHYDPSSYGRSNRELRNFYADMLTSLGITNARVNVSPYANQGDFSVVAANQTSDFYFPIANPSQGPIDQAVIAVDTGRSFVHGSLWLNTYITVAGGAINTSSENWIATGPVSNLTHWLYKFRTSVPAVDVNINTPGAVSALGFIDPFPNIILSYLRKRIAAVGVGVATTEVTEWFFSGLRIDY